jgi:hypothetical protein
MIAQSRGRLLIGFAIGGVVSIVLLFVADSVLRFWTTIQITNAVGVDFSRVEISWAGETAWSGSLRYGDKHEVAGIPPGEGMFHVHIEMSDGRSHAEQFGYTSTFLGGRYFITAREPPGGSFEVTIVYCNGGLFTRYCTS